MGSGNVGINGVCMMSLWRGNERLRGVGAGGRSELEVAAEPTGRSPARNRGS